MTEFVKVNFVLSEKSLRKSDFEMSGRFFVIFFRKFAMYNILADI